MTHMTDQPSTAAQRAAAIDSLATPPTRVPEAERPRSHAGRTLGIGISILIVLGLVAMCAAINGHTSTPGTSDYQADAQRVCHGFVKDELKSPASAQFSGDAVTGSGLDWTDVGNVDSDNSFGAPIRNTFSCEVTYNSADNQWTLVALDGLAN